MATSSLDSRRCRLPLSRQSTTPPRISSRAREPGGSSVRSTDCRQHRVGRGTAPDYRARPSPSRPALEAAAPRARTPRRIAAAVPNATSGLHRARRDGPRTYAWPPKRRSRTESAQVRRPKPRPLHVLAYALKYVNHLRYAIPISRGVGTAVPGSSSNRTPAEPLRCVR
jgi:hypothetical protein